MQGTDQIRQILSTRGLTVYRVSQLSAGIFGRSSLFFVPHNLSCNREVPSVRPSIHQLFALSKITNFRLCDWLTVFGFQLAEISRLQVLISKECTALVDSHVYDRQAWIPWFAERPRMQAMPTIAPLGQLLSWTTPRRAGELLGASKTKFLYAKVGEKDLLA